MAGVGGRVNIPVDDLERNGLGDPSGKGGGTSIVRSLGGEDSSCGVLEARSIDCRGGNAADKAVHEAEWRNSPTEMSPIRAGSIFISGMAC